MGKDNGERGKTQKKHALTPEMEKRKWKKGQSGNPAGRPKGATSVKNAIINSFYQFTYKKKEKGLPSFMAWAIDNPRDYFKMLASLLPKDLNITTDMVAAEFGRMVKELMPEQADEIAAKLEEALAPRH